MTSEGVMTPGSSGMPAVIAACANAPRPGQDGTWITAAMRRAYGDLHRLGHAHSVEVWGGDRLVGGLYGVSVGAAGREHRDRAAT